MKAVAFLPISPKWGYQNWAGRLRMKPHMPTSFAQFLRIAKLHTYAAQGDDASVTPVLLSTKQLEFSIDGYLYRDIYAGMNHFVGQEIVYQNDQAIWSMSYSGGMLIEATASAIAEVYRFLRAALQESPQDLPLRGPASLRSGQLTYVCDIKGDLNRFAGVEHIDLVGSPAYELHFSGGLLR